MSSSRPTAPETPPTGARHRSGSVNWRQEYLHVAVILMTACWLAPWLALTLNFFLAITLPTVLGLCTIHLLGSLFVVRWLVHRRTAKMIITLVVFLLMWTAAGVTILLMPTLARAYGSHERLALADLFYFDRYARVPAGPVITVWVLYLWWRGYQLGGAYTTLVRASFVMRLGILSFLWVCILGDHRLRQGILALLPAFFFFGLLASSLARADSLNLDRAGPGTAFGRGWIIALFGIALVLTASGYGAARWLVAADLGPVTLALSLAAQGFFALIILLSTPVILVVQLLFDVLKSVFPDQMPPSTTETGSGGTDAGGGFQAPWLTDVFQALGTALIAAIVFFCVAALLLFLWFLIVARAQQKEHTDRETETLGTGEIVGGWKGAFRESWQRLADLLGVFRQFGLGPGLFAAMTIRRIYARMEKLAGARGYPRVLSQTPYEYRRELHHAFPDQADAIHCITEAYVAVRYGEIPEDPAALQSVRDAWTRLQHSADPSTQPP